MVNFRCERVRRQRTQTLNRFIVYYIWWHGCLDMFTLGVTVIVVIYEIIWKNWRGLGHRYFFFRFSLRSRYNVMWSFFFKAALSTFHSRHNASARLFEGRTTDVQLGRRGPGRSLSVGGSLDLRAHLNTSLFNFPLKSDAFTQPSVTFSQFSSSDWNVTNLGVIFPTGVKCPLPRFLVEAFPAF